jgi:integrase/recombinase XerD
MKTCRQFPELLQLFFTDHLVRLRQASPHTIASYRDTFRLLLKFAKQRLAKEPSKLTIEDIAAPFLGRFLSHLERDRGNRTRSRNVRLAAIHSFFRYVALNEPTHMAVAQRVLALPTKRFDRKPIDFLTRSEVDALLSVPDQTTWSGRRDYALLLTATQTGLRVSELTGLRCEDIVLKNGAHVRCQGKGRKERATPLRKEAIVVLDRWIRERAGDPRDPLFPNARGGRLSQDGVAYIIDKHAAKARQTCSTLAKKRISAHVLRHALAMDLLHHGIDRSVIALWLGHESVETVQMYLHADMAIKEQVLAKLTPGKSRSGRYQPDDRLLDFLKGL